MVKKKQLLTIYLNRKNVSFFNFSSLYQNQNSWFSQIWQCRKAWEAFKSCGWKNVGHFDKLNWLSDFTVTWQLSKIIKQWQTLWWITPQILVIRNSESLNLTVLSLNDNLERFDLMGCTENLPKMTGPLGLLY